MASELDVQLRAIMERLTAPLSLFERDFIERDGQQLAVFKNAPQSLPALFDQFCTQHRDNPFLADGDVRLTFGEAHSLARRAARGLIAGHGIRRGDRVGIAGCNSASWIISYMAVLMAGGCATLLNGWWKGKELAEGIALADCALVLSDSERTARLAGHEGGVRIITYHAGEPALGLAPILADECDTTPLPELTGDDLATILFTSGSTGRSKAVCSDHRAVVQATMSFAAQSQALAVQLTEVGEPPAERQTVLLCVPLFHVTGEIAVLLQSFPIGRKLVVLPKWDAERAMQLIERERITSFVGVPLMSNEIATHPRRGEYDLSSCKSFAAGGAARPVNHVTRIRQAFPESYPLLGYGLTETNSVGCTNLNENYLAKPGSTGPASRPLVELVILDDKGRPLPPGTSGEIAIRSVCNFREYRNNQVATMQAIRPDGFFLTGDIGYLDEDGYLFIVDRKKDIIIRGGENIGCGEVEAAIYDHPGIAEVCVFALPEERYGEVPVAVYHPRPGVSLDEEELRAYLQQRIASFKIPVRFWREDQPLPRLATQKIDKLALKARYSQDWEDARSAA